MPGLLTRQYREEMRWWNPLTYMMSHIAYGLVIPMKEKDRHELFDFGPGFVEMIKAMTPEQRSYLAENIEYDVTEEELDEEYGEWSGLFGAERIVEFVEACLNKLEVGFSGDHRDRGYFEHDEIIVFAKSTGQETYDNIGRVEKFSEPSDAEKRQLDLLVRYLGGGNTPAWHFWMEYA